MAKANRAAFTKKALEEDKKKSKGQKVDSRTRLEKLKASQQEEYDE